MQSAPKTLLLCWMILGLGAMSSVGAASQIPRGPLPSDVRPLHYTLQLRVVPEEQRFSGWVRIRVELARPLERIWFHGLDLDVSSVQVEDANARRVAAKYAQRTEDGVAELELQRPLPAGTATLELHYSAPFSPHMDGLFKVVERDRSYAFTQFAQIDARRAFPGFDEPRFKTPFDVSIDTRRDYRAISNAPVRRESVLDGAFKRVEFATTARLPTSLLALAVGDLDVVSARPIPVNGIRRQEIPLHAVAAHGKGVHLSYALDHTAAVVHSLEEYFGLPYPYEKLDLIAVPGWGGAMENAAAITYAEKYLLIGADASAAQRQSFADVHAHELAHQWFGNLVTPAWWDDLWLNESFASWMGNRVAAGSGGGSLAMREALRDGLAAMDQDSRAQVQPIRRRIASTEDFAGGFSPLIYGKGGAVLTMLERFAGESQFRDGIRLYMRRFHDGVTTGDGFLRALAEGAKVPELAPAFVSYLDQPGVPLVSIDWRCRGGQLDIALAQTRYLPLGSRAETGRPWLVPVCLSLDDGHEHCTLLRQPRQSWTVAVDRCPTSLMPNAQGAGYYRFSLSPERMRELARRIDRLDAREALSVLDSLAAEFMAGRLSVEDYMLAVHSSASHPAADVLVAPLPTLRLILGQLTKPEHRLAFRQWLIDRYRTRVAAAARLGEPSSQDADELSLMRSTLLPFVALELHDDSVRTPLLRLGRAHLSGGAEAALPQDLLPVVLAITAQDDGQPALDRLWARFASSTDMMFRRSVLTAFAQVTNPPQAAWVRDKLLAPQIGENEAVDLFVEQAAAGDNLAASWSWLRKHLDELAARVPAFRRDQLIGAMAGFCTESKRRELDTVLTPAVADIEDGARALADTVERIETCIALAGRSAGSAPAPTLQ